MERDLDAIACGLDLLRIEDIAFKDFKVGEISNSTVIDLGQIEYMDSMSSVDKSLDDKGSKFSCATSDKNSHGEALLGGRVFKTPPKNLKFFNRGF